MTAPIHDTAIIKRFTTRDFYLAAYLHAKGFVITRIYGNGPDQEITLAEVKGEEVLSYSNETAQLGAKTLFDAYRDLKNRVQEARMGQQARNQGVMAQAQATPPGKEALSARVSATGELVAGNVPVATGE